jgi:spermidine/putrescine transport system substrate-binding protein
MTDKVDANSVAAGTAAAARAFTRRGLLKASALGGAALALTGPAILNPARAAGGEVRIFAWAGYVTDEMLDAFKSATGITPVRTEYGTNDELLNQLRASQGGGFDIIWPSSSWCSRSTRARSPSTACCPPPFRARPAWAA